MTRPLQSTLFADARMETPQCQDFLRGEVCAFSTPSPLKADGNEDAALFLAVDASCGVLAVADGVGGMPGGEIASSIAVHCLARTVEAGVARGLPVRECILESFEQASSTIAAQGTGAATTFAVAQVEHDRVRTFHSGDSEILIVRRNGNEAQVLWRTLPHSPVGYGVEAGLLDPREAIFHESRHLVSNVVGSNPMSVEMSSLLELQPGDTLLLASDGLLDNLHLEEVVSLAVDYELHRGVARLAAAARRRMAEAGGRPSKPDDLTFLVYRPRATA